MVHSTLFGLTHFEATCTMTTASDQHWFKSWTWPPTSLTPGTAAAASTWCAIMGMPASGKSGFGRSRERGRKRVPFWGPAIKITAFIAGIFILSVDKFTEINQSKSIFLLAFVLHLFVDVLRWCVESLNAQTALSCERNTKIEFSQPSFAIGWNLIIITEYLLIACRFSLKFTFLASFNSLFIYGAGNKDAV